MTEKRVKLLVALSLFVGCLVVGAQDSPSSVEAAPAPLNVWLPAPLISDESGPAYQLLSDHTAEFSSDNEIGVAFRIKAVGSIGGIMSSIRAGKEVAPGALPDVTLIRRRDFTPSQAIDHLQSMETLFTSSLINDLDDGVEFGQIPLDGNDTLYGLPYFFDLLLSVTDQPLDKSGDRLSFADLLTDNVSFLFPAARANGLNQTFYLQYLAAGGSGPIDGIMTIDEDALRTVLQFYEDLMKRGLVSPDVLTFQSPTAYLADFISESEQRQLAVSTASEFLAIVDAQAVALHAAEIPTADANLSSIRNGWLWVIVTPDRNRQALAARFIEWMMEPEFHANFGRALYLLPSQPAILADSLPAAIESQLLSELLSQAVESLPEGEGGTAPRLMQEALINVLHGDATASEATLQALNQFAER